LELLKTANNDDFGRGKKAMKKFQSKDNSADWIIFNRGEPFEFAECSKCGREQEPIMMIYGAVYPQYCRGCHREMVRKIDAKEVV